MAPVSCLETFEAAPEDATRAAAIDRAHPNCACEDVQVSRHCVEPVGLGESLARLVLDPTHIEIEAGRVRLKTSFFSDAASFGSSCLRKERAEPQEYIKTIEEMLSKTPNAADGSKKKLIGILIVEAAAIKAEVSETKDNKGNIVDSFPAFGIYATGLPERPNHADVMVNRVSSISRSQANRAGITLTKKINEAITAGKALISVPDFKETADLTAWAG